MRPIDTTFDVHDGVGVRTQEPADRRLAVISGGGTGIGLAIARTLVSDGMDVILVGRRATVLDAAVAEVNDWAGHEAARAVPADLTDLAGVEAVTAVVAALARPLDVLVNNAGGNLAPYPPTSVAELRDQFLANLTGNVLPVVLLTHALLNHLRRPGGRIITMSSIAALRGNISYGAAKAALHPWSNELALQLAPEGITVNVIAPGFIGDTEFYGERMRAKFTENRARQIPVGRAGASTEVAGLVRYLSGPDAGFVTGQVLQINGGALTGRG